LRQDDIIHVQYHSATERSVMRTLLIAVFAAAALPSVANATSVARQEFLDATRATPNLERGAELFSNCAACHGRGGEGTSDGSVPAIGGQHLPVLLKQLVDFRHNRRWDNRMEHFVDRHHLKGAQEIADVAGYVNQLPTRQQKGVGDGKAVGHGATAYFQHCASCHGATGQGGAKKQVPRLAGQHYEYLLRQFHDTADGRRPNMNDEHVRLFRGLEMQDFVGLADYLSRLIPEGTGRTE
jgi:cytochrome c553